MPDVIMFQGERSPSVSDTIKVAGAAFDLTGSSVKFQMRLRGSSTLKVDAAAVIVTAASGTVRYDWASADVDTPGEYEGWWLVTLPSTKTQSTPEFAVYVRAHAPASTSDLCTLGDVRELLEITSTDTSRDDYIRTLISSASKAICSYTDREFAPASSGVTRTFRADWLIDLAPYDLRAATTVTLNPEDSSPTTLTSSDYALEPTHQPQGVYKRIRISYLQSLGTSQFSTRFGYAKVSILGDWGFASVPNDVKLACVRTVGSWMDRSLQAYAGGDLFAEDPRVVNPGAVDSSYGIPGGARLLLAPYRRGVGP